MANPSATPPARGAKAYPLVAFLAAVVLALATYAALACLRPPPVPEDAGPEEFSAVRAREDVAFLALSPHPLGSPRQRQVRDYLERRLGELGLEPQVQRTVSTVGEGPGWTVAASVENVMARLPGNGEEGAVLLAAHYDTVPGSPGANDNGAAVAALLETARALTAGPRLRRDVIFLFTDGEEVALSGARAFRQQHPWMGEVTLVLNFEARGLGGPSLMFETGPGTGPDLVSDFAAAAPRPVAASYGQDIYRYLPNDTDFTELSLRSGVPGFNFAYIEGLEGYHSRLDNLENLDLTSLQHHGTYALRLARRFAGGTAPVQDGTAVAGGTTYFNLPAVGLVVYPTAWAPVPLVAAVIVLGLVAFLGLRRGALRGEGIGLGLVAALLGLAAGSILSLIADRAALGVAGTAPGGMDGPWPYLLAMPLFSVAGVGAALLIARRWLNRLEQATGVLLLWLTLAVLSLIVVPSSSYLASWPLLAAAGATLAGVLVSRSAGGGTRRWPGSVVGAGLAVLATLGLLWVPLAYLLGIAFGAPGAGILAVVSSLAALLVLPLLPGAGWPRPWLLVAIAAGAGVAVTAIALAGAGHDADDPRPDTLFYIYDTEAEEAWWGSFDPAPSPWTGRFLHDPQRREVPDLFARRPYLLLTSPAPVLDLVPPSLDVLSWEPAGKEDRRLLHLRVVSPRRGHRVRLALTGEASPLRLVQVAGQPVESEEAIEHQELRYFNVPEEGFEVTVETGPGPVAVTLSDRVRSLPGRRELGWEGRPPETMPQPSMPTDFSEVRVRTVLSADDDEDGDAAGTGSEAAATVPEATAGTAPGI